MGNVKIQEIQNKLSEGKSGVRVSKELGIHYNTLLYHLKKAGVKLSKISHQSQYSLDESVFDKITEESAYWLGFLMADGCVYIVPEKRINRIVINLQILDVGHLEKFRKFLKAERTVHINKNGEMASFGIGSKRLCKAVMKYGVVPRKCKNTKVIGLESNRHFWRGVIDGDGCLYRNQRSKHIQLSGSNSLLIQFSNFIRSHFPEYKATVRHSKHCFTVCVGIKAIGLLYNDCTVALDRKLNLAKSFIS